MIAHNRRKLGKTAILFTLGWLLGGKLFAGEKKPEEELPPDQWRAWAVTEGEQTRIVVEGIYQNGGPGTVVILKDHIPPGLNPRILLLELQVAKLPGVWPAVIQPVPAVYVKAPFDKSRYDSVTIRYPGGKTARMEIIDAGAGPK